MRITLALIATAVAYWLFDAWMVALIVGGATWVWVGPSASGTKRVMVEDFQTGRVKIQPMDADTKRYLNTRKDK